MSCQPYSGGTMTDRKSQNRQRWLIFTVLALMYVLVYFYRVSLAVVAQDISRELHLTPQQLGFLSGVLFFVYAVAQLPLGPMIDRLGSRIVISGCGVLTACGGILFSRAGSLAAAMTARMMIGIGTASVLMATFTVFSHWYTKQEFGRVSGFMVAVGNLGNLSATAPLALAVASVGWRASFLTIGVIQACATALVYLKVQDRPAAIGSSVEHAHPRKVDMLAAWREIFGNLDFWLLGGLAFFWYGNYLALQGLWGGPYLQEVLCLSRGAAGRMLMFTSLGFISGSMVIDTIARKVFRSYKKTLVAGQMVLLFLMTAFLGKADALPQPVLAAVFYAVGLAVSSGVMVYPIIRSMFSVHITGTALTSLNFFVLMGAALTQQVMGVIIGRLKLGGVHTPADAFHAAFLFPTIGLAISIVSYLFARDYWEKP